MLPDKLIVRLSSQDYVCEIKPSGRARYLRIKLSHAGDLSVVVPRGVGMNTVQQFITQQLGWIEKKVSELDPTASRKTRPETLELKYLDQVWTLHYTTTGDSQGVKITETSEYNLECAGLFENRILLEKSLGQWLKRKAEGCLPERLSELAQHHGFHYNRVAIRGQKTRWASCSSQKNINLNYKLLFLEKPLVDYVLIHELCHTLQMNHSKRFWDLVADCDDHYREHDKQLNQLARSLPI